MVNASSTTTTVPQIYQSDTFQAGTVQVSPRPVDEADGGRFRLFGFLRGNDGDQHLLSDASYLAVHFRLRRRCGFSYRRCEPGGPRSWDEDGNVPNLRVHAGLQRPLRNSTSSCAVLPGRARREEESGAQSESSPVRHRDLRLLHDPGHHLPTSAPFDRYTWDDTYKVWTDRSNDKDYMKKLVDGGQQPPSRASLKPNSDKGGACGRGSPTPPP